MNNQDFEQSIAPFFWVEHDQQFSVCLDVGEYRQAIFDSRSDEGFEGNGYDWQALASVFLHEQLPEYAEIIEFDSESGMFCAYSDNADALKTFILAFKAACEDEALILDIFSRAELD